MRVAVNIKLPDKFTVPATTSEPGFFSSGIDSPVNIDSSTAELPSTNTPSTGIFSPGLIRNVSPIPTFSMGISNSTPSLITLAVLGCSPISWRIALEVLPLARVSKPDPKLMKANITTAASK